MKDEILPITLFTQGYVTIQIPVGFDETAAELAKRLGCARDSKLYYWPQGMAFNGGERVVEMVRRHGIRLYVVTKDELNRLK